MNDRPRRQPATRRRATQETGGEISQHNPGVHNNNHSSSHHHRPNLLNSAPEHHHLANNYHNNLRHPSTTTTSSSNPSTNPTSSQSTDDDCAFSICYSYLIAIFSSFLVVLGLYLAITRFNVRYLYISLVGLSFEALGACIYCLSNTRTRKLTRRKQRVSNANNNAYILNGSTSNDTNNGNISTTNQNNVNPILQISNPYLRGQQPNASNLNHILENTTQTCSTNTSNNTTRITDHADETLANLGPNDTNSVSQRPQLPLPRLPTNQSADDQLASLNSNQNETPMSVVKEENSAVIISVSNDVSQLATTSTTPPFNSNNSANIPKQLPTNDGCQTKTQEFSNSLALSSLSHSKDIVDSAATTVHQQTHSNLAEIPSTTAVPLDTPEAFTKNQDNISLSLNLVSNSIPAEDPSNVSKIAQDPQVGTSANLMQQHQQQLISINNSTSQLSTSNSIDLIQLSLGNDDLTNVGQGSTDAGSVELNINTSSAVPSYSGLVPSASSELLISMRRSPSQNQRNAHLRRTLVVGLGGEEELMEIDEEDLDNMSIMPPSYDSIAHNRP